MILNKILSDIPLLFDGAMGTELQKKGLQTGNPPEIFLLENPDLVKEVHLSYINAGSKVLETNTFGANRKRLEFACIDDKFREINSKAAEIALQAAGKDIYVAGSIGPLGVTIEPFGELSKQEASDIFSEQILILKESGIKIFLIETMISLDEALIALQAATELNCEIVGVTLTFDIHSNSIRTPFGETPEQAAQALKNGGADFIGSNCGQGFSQMLKIAEKLKSSTDLPLLIQPNAGLPEFEEGVSIYKETPEMFADFVRFAKQLGVEMIGGCCGTTPMHIKAAREDLNLIK